MEDEFFKAYKLYDMEPFLCTFLLQDIKEDLGLSLPSSVYSTYFVGSWEIDDYCEEFFKVSRKTSLRLGNN
jgi:hypothetical protein